MKRFTKRMMSAFLALALVVTALAGGSLKASAATTQLTNPKFVRENGSDLAMSMGTGVVSSAYYDDEDEEITINLKSYSLLIYTGTIDALYVVSTNSDGSYNRETGNLLSGTTAVVSADYLSDLSSSKQGVHVELHFSFNIKPPMMNLTQYAYFTCDEF